MNSKAECDQLNVVHETKTKRQCPVSEKKMWTVMRYACVREQVLLLFPLHSAVSFL